MTEQAEAFCRELFSNTPALKDLERDFREGVSLLCGCFQAGGKLLTCGNGGSAADSEHIVGELMKGFLQKRPLTEEERAAIASSGCPEPEKFSASLQRGLPAISFLERDFREGVSLLCGCFQAGGKLLTCGNGGSAADSEHIVGELMKGFLQKRPLTEEERAAIASSGCPEPEKPTRRP